MQRYYNAEGECPYFVILQKEASKMQNKSHAKHAIRVLVSPISVKVKSF